MYKLHLILKYLLKRRIAWVSLLAVALCTTMVLVVISVMGGWLTMFKTAFRGLSGDIVIHSISLKGFPHYQKVIDAISKDPECQVQAALPTIETGGLFNWEGGGPVYARVMGFDISKIDTVNDFGSSLFRQHSKKPPSFGLLDLSVAPLASLPADIELAPPSDGQTDPTRIVLIPPEAPTFLRYRLKYDTSKKQLTYSGIMGDEARAMFKAMSKAPEFGAAIDQLFTASKSPDIVQYPRVTGKYTGLIVGTGVIGVRRNKDGVWERPGQAEWDTRVALTLLDLSSGQISQQNAVTRNYFIVDDSHVGVWQYDNSYVYVPIDQLQRDLGMDAQRVEIDGKNYEKPAHVTDIHIKVSSKIDPNNEGQLRVIRDRIEQIMRDVLLKEDLNDSVGLYEHHLPIVETWQDTQRIWISAVENEKMLMVVLFGIMCIVAIFLIFCIFYMIVVEKTRDIGIIKSVGATSAGVASIFLGYGLIIGVIGALGGLGISYLIVHYINEIHAWLGRAMHVTIFDPQVYLFDKIPNTMSLTDIAWILPTAVLASVLGAFIPAIRAASVNPVESLRWE